MRQDTQRDGEPKVSNKGGEGEPTCEDTHVSDDRDAIGHVIETHAGSQHHRGESETPEADKGLPQDNNLIINRDERYE